MKYNQVLATLPIDGDSDSPVFKLWKSPSGVAITRSELLKLIAWDDSLHPDEPSRWLTNGHSYIYMDEEQLSVLSPFMFQLEGVDRTLEGFNVFTLGWTWQFEDESKPQEDPIRYAIRIVGAGTASEITEALSLIGTAMISEKARVNIQGSPDIEHMDGSEWLDCKFRLEVSTSWLTNK